MEKFENYRSNLEILKRADQEDLSNDFIISGIIDMFMVQFELGWKLLKELLRYEGDITSATSSPRQIVKAAYRFYPFIDEEIWLEMLTERNQTAHIYNKKAAAELVGKIIDRYIPEFVHVENEVEQMYGEQLNHI